MSAGSPWFVAVSFGGMSGPPIVRCVFGEGCGEVSAFRGSETYFCVADRLSGPEGGCESTPFGLARGRDAFTVPASWYAGARGCPTRASAVYEPISDRALKNSVITTRECCGEGARAISPGGRRGEAKVVATYEWR